MTDAVLDILVFVVLWLLSFCGEDDCDPTLRRQAAGDPK